MAQSPLDHQTLFNARLLARSVIAAPVPEAHQQIVDDWAVEIRSGAIKRRSEQQIRAAFTEKFFIQLLGYQRFGSGQAFTLADESYVGKGRADVMLGQFSTQGDVGMVPVELKGADTTNLDVMMPGRYKSPVQQAWEYAMDLPHCKFVMVTNMLEIRLYAVGYTRRVYERFDLADLASSPQQYQRLMLLLGASNLLGGRTAELLTESALIEKQITRELYADYKRWRIQLITALAQTNAMAPGELITPSQKLLDRVLFVAFAQQRGLLPAGTLASVHNSSGWAVQPKYDHYKTLFKAIDTGLPERGIPPYNGGLFAFDALLDSLSVPNAACDVFMAFGKYDFGGEVSVNVLGHIFEQSITDLEQLKDMAETGEFTLEAITRQADQASARQGSAGSSVSGARKEHGIVYTPEFITAFILDQTLTKTIDGRRNACASSYQIQSTQQVSRTDEASASALPEWRKPTAEEKKYAKILRQSDRVVELAFWRAWLAELTTIKVCDPACGSGAFLVAAFDVLLAEYNNVNEQIAAITGSMEVFNADKEILNSNLFGVDLNAESIEITKLSLWLKTAKHGKPLESLESNLRVGNSLVSPADDGLKGASFDAKAFDWASAFPDVVARGGFDVIVGNPPYVRMERLKAFKPYFEKRYEVASERADLYCYFFELAIRLLRNGNHGGRIGFISSSTFFKTGSGQNLRAYLLKHAQIETVVDFGDLQVFEGVTTYPAIITARRSGAPDGDALVRFWNVKDAVPPKFSEAFLENAQAMPQSRLNAHAWQFESDARSALRQKILGTHPTLKDVYGAPLYGIKTGLNDAFVLNRHERDAIVEKDPKSAELLKPFLEGKDLKKWRVEPQDLWLIYIPKNRIVIDDYPAIKAHLLTFKAALEKRATKQEWFELQQAQEAYAPVMALPKTIYAHFSSQPLFSFDAQGFMSNDKSYVLGSADQHLPALLNSRVCWWLLKQLCPAVRGGFHELRVQYVEQLPVPCSFEGERERLAELAQTAQTAAQARRDELARFGRAALRDLVPGGLSNLIAPGGAKLPAAWHEAVPAFDDFTRELKKRFKRELNLTERNDWDAAVHAAHARVAAFTQQITQAERAIDSIVYQLFDLSPADIALIEA
jgi:N-6 DNA Methylase/TaqI-like C-terminal specificity domain